MNIMLLEDDAELVAFISKGLKESGHAVVALGAGQEALSALLSERFDVAVLERLVPGMGGVSVVRHAREAGCQTPILILSALSRVEDRVAGLDAGADDYLVKPFAFSELVARLNALARRPPNIVLAEVLKVGDIELDLRRRTVKRAGKPIDLQPREFSLLEQLMRSPDRVMTRTLLLDKLWGLGFDPRTNIVETHMSRLRTKLNRGFDHDAIRTVRGAGYILRQPDE